MPEFDKKQHSEPHPFAVAPSDAKAAEKRADPALDLAQMPWLSAFGFLGDSVMAAMSRGDGMTTQERGVKAGWKGGPTVDVSSSRKTEVDANHAMESAVRMGYADKNAYAESSRGGKWVDDEGAQRSDSASRRVEAGSHGVHVSGKSQETVKKGDDSTQTKSHHEVGYGPDGPTGAVGRSVETKDGINTHSRDASASYGDKGLKITTGASRETKVDDDHQMGQQTRATYEGGRATFEHGKSSRIADDDLTGVVNSEKKNTRVSVGKGGPAVERSHEHTTEVDGQTFTDGTTYGYKDGKVQAGKTKSRTYTGEDGREHTDSSGTTVGAGRDGANVGYSRERATKEGGSSASSVNASVDWSKGEGTVAASHSVTGENGNKISAGGHATVNSSGELTDAAGEVSFAGKSGTTASASGSYHVDAGEPVPRDGGFAVSWTRTVKGGASAGKSGGHGGVKVGAEASHKDMGTRVFRTKAEAEYFVKHAASLLPTDQPDPGTVAGALAMEVGESRGSNDGVSGSVGVTGKAGVASAGVSAEKGSNHGTLIERVSPNVFLVTVSSGENEGLSGQIGVGGLSAGGYTQDAQSRSKTVRFDLSTAEGQAAFEVYNRSGILPNKGGKVVSRTEAEQHRHGTRLNYGPAGSASFNSTTFDSTTYDEKGKTDVHGGTYDQSVVSNIPFMKGHDNMAISLVGVEHNDRERSYALQGNVDSTDGEWSRKHLAEITGMRYYSDNDASHGGVKSSGKWRVDVNFSREQADEFMKEIESERVRDVSIFESGPDNRNNLRKDLKAAQSSDDRMKAIAKFVAEDGFGGKAMGTMRKVLFGQANGAGLDNHYLGNFDYDLKLDGDRNFRGVEGRLEVERKIAGYQNLMAVGEASASTLVGPLQSEILELRRQRAEIADPKRYTDLPEELRAQQVAKLDMYIATIGDLRRQAALSATRNDPGKVPSMSDGERYDQELAEAEGGKGDPKLAALRKLRHQISSSDEQISTLQYAYQMLRGELKPMVTSNAGIERAGQYRRQYRTIRDGVTAMVDVEKAASAAARATDELRVAFIQALNRPDEAIALGGALLVQLRMSESQLTAAVDQVQRQHDFFTGEMELHEEAPVYQTIKTNTGYRDFATREEWGAYLRGDHKEGQGPSQGHGG